MTGWKIGWVTGPRALVAAVRTTKQFLTYVSGAPFQPAVAVGLGLDDSFYATLAGDLRRERDLLCAGLASWGFRFSSRPGRISSPPTFGPSVTTTA